jgi:hypothetical protein
MPQTFSEFVREAQWSADVETHWNAPEGTFTGEPAEVAARLKKASKTYAQAMERLSFYLNRAGKNVDGARGRALKAARRGASGRA